MVHKIPRYRKSQHRRSKAWHRLMLSRCWINGEEVTKRCFYADPRRGVVRLYVLDANGKPQINRQRDGVMTEERRGRVKCFVSRKKAAR